MVKYTYQFTLEVGMFFKKDSVEFEATKIIYVGTIECDENRQLLLVKNGFNKTYIKTSEIQDIIITCGQKSVSKKNIGGALAGAAVFGIAGVLLAGSTHIDYISNLTITIITTEKRVCIPLVIGKVKAGNWLQRAERIVADIEGLMG